jgi:hypothetical protein
MPKRSRKPQAPDVNQIAYQVVKQATEQADDSAPADTPSQDEVSRVMAIMGRKGGLKGGKRRLETMTPDQRRQAAFKAAKARWAKAKKRRR